MTAAVEENQWSYMFDFTKSRHGFVPYPDASALPVWTQDVG
jgi:hypothetical protein